ncbi:MAG TPA: hypothetical protein VFI06_11160 [Chitinophagaceae bacterium]|nr:hypothetical protein [Chitinophagaceae bacterium]
MKKSLGLLSLLLVSGAAFIFSGCKKENTKEDVSALFKNTEWTGEIKYSNKPVADPYSIEFFQDGSLKWHQISGDYDGIYTIDAANRKISISSGAVGAVITAIITQDNKFSNISPTNILSCEVNKSGPQDLDNTNWKGKLDRVIPFEMNFRPGKKVLHTGFPVEQSYQRAGSAVLVITNASKYFSVIQPDNKTIKGIANIIDPFSPNPYPYYPLDLIKQ